MLAPNGPDWVVWWLAVTRIGAVMVPLNTFYKPRELGYVLRHSDASALITVARFLSNDYLERLEACAPGLAGQRAGALYARELPHLRHVFVSGDAGGRAGPSRSLRSKPPPTRRPRSTPRSSPRWRRASRPPTRWS